MPWTESTPVSHRQEFIRLYLKQRHSMAELCRTFGVSQKTGYKWLARFAAHGTAGLADRSHAPLTPAHQVAPEVRAQILRAREAHPRWGPKKLRTVLSGADPTVHWPAHSTIGELLKRSGLSKPRRRSGAAATWMPIDHVLTGATAPNDVWTADFKGEFRLSSGMYCYPLTVADMSSRFLLGCTGLSSTATELAQTQFRRLFQKYGLPSVIRTDNGVPFAAPMAIGRLSTLSVWWIRLGIRPERTKPGNPQQNGRHERMHRTLKEEAVYPPSASLAGQQKRFDRFQMEFNHDRPHEALGQTTPASHYTASMRPYPVRLPAIDYSSDLEVRRVSTNGTIRWKGAEIWLTSTLARQDVSFKREIEDTWIVAFGPLVLGRFHSDSGTFIPEVYWQFPESDG